MPTDADLNLLFALNALLSEGSVAKAAERLGLSESAMSRALARLRESTGDELLVRAGRAMVLTPHALALRDRVRELVQESRAVLHPRAPSMDPRTLQHRSPYGPTTASSRPSRISWWRAPRTRRPAFACASRPSPTRTFAPARGLIDLDVGVLGESGPEVRVQALFRDHFVAVVRQGHPLLAAPGITVERYAACDHVVTSRQGRTEGPVDVALAAMGLVRNAAVVVPSFSTALSIAAATDMVALIPSSYFEHLRARGTLCSFPLPMPTEQITVSQMWHPRLDRDPAHRWLRGVVLEVCRPLNEPAKAP
jgi:DNA-binding transcriptional LysR family regulator